MTQKQVVKYKLSDKYSKKIRTHIPTNTMTNTKTKTYFYIDINERDDI